MRNLIVLLDTREKQNWHITNGLNQLEVAHRTETIKTGDITFELNGKDYRDQFAIERKANFGELKSNLLSKDHKRVKAEFQRAVDIEYFYLLIEESKGYDAIEFTKNWSFKTTNARFKAVFNKFIQLRQYERLEIGMPKLKIVYCHKADSAKLIIKLIYKFIKDKKL